MLIDYSPALGRDEVELETSFKLIKELFVSGRVEILHNGEMFERMNFPSTTLVTNELRIESVLKNKKVIKNTFLYEDGNNRVFYFGRIKTDTEKFSDIVEDLF